MHSVALPGRYVSSVYNDSNASANTVFQARKSVNYVESDDDEDEMFAPIANNSRGRATKRMRVSLDDDSDDEFGLDAATQQAMLEDDGAFPSCHRTKRSQSFQGADETQIWTTSSLQTAQTMTKSSRRSANDHLQRNLRSKHPQLRLLQSHNPKTKTKKKKML